MDKVSQKFLAGSCFTLNEYSGIFVSYFGGTVKNFVHFRIIDQKLGTVNVLLCQRTDFLFVFGHLNHLFTELLTEFFDHFEITGIADDHDNFAFG